MITSGVNSRIARPGQVLSLGRRRWSPAALFASGEAGAWYVPGPTTCFTDTAGTTPAGIGDSVARINDLSGNGNHATRATVAARPTLQQTAGGLWYLDFDGIDDSMITPTITPGSDKLQFFAGVRKLSDGGFATAGMIAELSVSSGAANGTFFCAGPNLTRRYDFRSRGSMSVETGTSSASFNAPTTNILTGIGDISNDIARLRIDGAQVAQSTADQGAGDYLAYPLYIGARAGASLFFNGRIYSLIVRFGPNLSADTIGKAESYVAARTGVTL